MKKGQYRVRGESRHIVGLMIMALARVTAASRNATDCTRMGSKTWRRKQAELKAKRDRGEEDNRNWSCARCGVFHALAG